MCVRTGKNVSAISARNIFLSKNFPRVAKSSQLAVEKNHLIEKLGHGFQIVMGRDDEVTISSKLVNRLPEQVLRGFVETSERFVQQKNVGLLRKRPREKCALLLPTG